MTTLNLAEVFEDGDLNQYVNDNLSDPWKDTSFEGYVFMSPKQKGEFGERLISKFFSNKLGIGVKKAHSSTAGHDRVISGFRTEMKFSLANRDKNNRTKHNVFVMNHVSAIKDWERLVFFGINRDGNHVMFWFTKEDFLSHMKSHNPLFSYQQAGKKGGNDDFMCTKVHLLIKEDWVNEISEW